MNRQAFAFVLAFSGVILTALAQILLKKGAIKAIGKARWKTWLHPLAIAGYATLFGVTILNLLAFQILPLKYAVILLPCTFMLVALFSRIFLHERLNRKQLGGAATIIAGLILFNL